MDMNFKRFLWVGQLTLILATSLLSGIAVNNIIRGELSPFLKPQKISTSPKQKPNKASKTPVLSSLGSERWVPKPPKDEGGEEGSADATEGTKKEDVVLVADGEYPLSDLNIQLNGTMVAQVSEYSMAMMQDRGSKATLLMNIGEKFQEKYDTKLGEIVKIERDRIVIQRDGQLEQIDLENQGRGGSKGKKKYPPSSRPKTTPAKSSPKPSPKPSSSSKISKAPKKGNSKLDKLRDGITKKGENNYAIKRDTIKEVIKNPRLLRDGTKPVPNYVGGKPNGFKLVGMKEGSIYYDLGIRPGDIITGINGKKLSSPNVALEFYQKFNSGSLNNVKLDVERGGSPTTINFGVQ